MSSLLPFLTDTFGWVGSLALLLNVVLITFLLKVGKTFAGHLLEELREIRELLGNETKQIRASLSNHGERISWLEARADQRKHNEHDFR